MSISNEEYKRCLNLLDSLENTIQAKNWILPIGSLSKELDKIEKTFKGLPYGIMSPDDSELKVLEDKITKIENLSLPSSLVQRIAGLVSTILKNETAPNLPIKDHKVLGEKLLKLHSELAKKIELNRHPRLEHPDLIDMLMILYGQKSSPEGVCSGFTLSGLQAILSEHIDEFDARLKRLDSLHKQALKKDSRIFSLLYDSKERSNKESIPLATAVHEVLNEKGIYLSKKDAIDLCAFFEAIQIGQRGYKYPHLFEQDVKFKNNLDLNFIKSTLKVIASEALEKKGSLVDLPFLVVFIQSLNLFNILTAFLKPYKKTLGLTLQLHCSYLPWIIRL